MSSQLTRSTGGMASSTAVHARVAVRPVRHCPVTRLAGEYGLQELVPPGCVDRAPQAVVETTAADGLREVGAHPVARMDDVLHCSFAALDTAEIRRVIRAFGNADFLVELEQLVRDEEDGIAVATARTAVCTLDRLTERQREVAAATVEQGYFEPDGPSADEMAATLDIAKPTLSEHLQTVQRELVRQAFPNDC